MTAQQIQVKVEEGELKEQEHHVEISKHNLAIQEILLDRKRLNFSY